MRFALLVTLLGGCGFPLPSDAFACQTTTDCDGDRVCDQGFCVVSSDRSTDGGGVVEDGPTIDAPPDADPFETIKPMCTAAGYSLVAGPDGYYRTVTNNKSWVDAETDCQNDVPGATHLIVLSTAAEATYMKTQLGWVGLTDRAAEGTFVNVTGEPNDPTLFSSGQPDNGNGSNEDCAQMKSDGLDDDQCGNGHRYVCECDGRTSPAP